MFNIVHNFNKIDQYSGVFCGILKDLPTIFNNRNCVRLLDALRIKANKDHLRLDKSAKKL
jgi:hypothetical protein